MQTKLFSLVFLAIVACGSNDNSSVTSGELTADAAKQKATTFVPGGAVGDAQRIATAEEDRWAVPVSTPGGGQAVVELERLDGRLDEISSEKGPWEYDLPAAGPGLLLYSKARALATQAKPGTFEKWELNIGENIWEFYVRDADQKLWEVKLDAKSGALISAVQKDLKD